MTEKIILLLMALAAGLSSLVPSGSEIQAYFEQGQKLFVIEDYSHAIEKYEKILSIKSPFLDEDKVMIRLSDEFNLPVTIAARYQLGNSHKNLGNYDQAVPYFKEVERSAPDEKLRSMAQYQVVQCRYIQENYTETITESRLLIEKYDRSMYVEHGYYNIGWAAFKLEDYDQAIDYFTWQLQKFPNGEYAPRAQYQIGECQFKQEAYRKAIEAYRTLISTYLPEGFSQRQWTDVELDRLKKRSQIESGVGKGRKEEHLIELSAKAFIKAGDAYLKLDQPDSAIINYRRVTEDYKPLTDLVETAYIKIAAVDLEHRGLDAGLAVYRDAIDHSEERIFQGKMQYQIAKVSLDNKAYEQAIENFELYAEGYAEVADEVGFTLDEARYQIAATYYEAEDFNAALLNYQVVVDSFRTSYLVPVSHYGIGLCQQRMGAYQPAVETFQYFITAYPQHEQVPNAYLQIARIYYDQKEYAKSIESYQGVLNQFSDSSRIDINTIYFELGICYRDALQYDDAIRTFKKISKESPFLPGAYSEMSEIYLKQNDYQSAVSILFEILRVLDASESRAQIHYYIGRVYVTANEFDNALKYFNLAIDSLTNPQLHASALFGRGAIYFEKKEYSQAIADFEALLREEADRNTKNKARRRLATCYLQTGQADKALTMARSFVDEAKNDADRGDALLTLAQIQYELKRYADGINTTNAIFDLKVEDEVLVQANFLQGNCYLGQADYQNAVTIYQNALQRYPDTRFASDLMFQLGIAYYNASDFESASREFQRQIAAYPRNENTMYARYYRAYSLYRLGDWAAAAGVFGSLADGYPAHDIAAECRFQQAECLFNARDFDRALTAYQQLQSDYPRSEYAARALYNSAWTLVNRNETEEAMKVFHKIVDVYPDSVYAVDALFTIADYYYNDKRYDEASAAYQRVMDKYPEHELAQKAREHIHELAQITSFLEYEKASQLFDDKKYREAIKAFETIVEKYPDADVVVGSRCNIAASYEQLGEMEMALKIYESIMTIYKDSPGHADAYAFAKEHRDWIKENY
ncbi:tetratricopeptide repeat protein [candidate division KSB1 bacterium]|nr:tetratricopeptide repeat protein [candidate division KSB1 bacterium]